jgi:DNA-binding transcriptional LysR family regulator
LTGIRCGRARALKSTQPTIGRQISALEGSLGVTLLERSVRGLTLTQAGRELLDHVRAMGEAATLISMVAAGQSQEVTGEVTVTATDLMAAAILPAILAPLRQSAPGIRVRIVATSDIRNLMQREADSRPAAHAARSGRSCLCRQPGPGPPDCPSSQPRRSRPG